MKNKVLIFTVLIFVACFKDSRAECSFINGKCIYDMRIGQEGKCDSVLTNVDTHVTGGQISGSCTCDDVSRVNIHMNSLKYTQGNLQQLLNELQQHLDNITSELNATDSKLNSEKQKNTNLKTTLNTKTLLLNQTKDELANVFKSREKELNALRESLENKTRDLSLCQTTLGTTVTAQTVLRPEFTTFFCGFEEHNLCGFSQDSSDNGDWTRKSQSTSSQTGPKTDHTYGNKNGNYMLLQAYPPVSSQKGTTARLISPTFQPSPNYCLRFWYNMYGKDVKQFSAYAKVNGGLGYPIFTHSGTIDDQWHLAEIALDKEYTGSKFQIVFEANHDSYHVYRYSSGSHYHYDDYNQYGNIAIDDVYVYNTTCSSIPTHPAGAFMRPNGKVTSYYTFHGKKMNWIDAEKACKKENVYSTLAAVNDAAEQQFLVNLIVSDIGLTSAGQNGFYLSGNDIDSENHFEWIIPNGYPEVLNYTNWHVGQPNNVGDNQDCLLMQYPASNYQWGDVPCSESHAFICETEL